MAKPFDDDDDPIWIARRLHEGIRCAICSERFQDSDSITIVEAKVEFSVVPPWGARGKLIEIRCHQECLETEFSH